ncbi:hypothetical protein Ddye_031029 [Dipteronia dyeriana]|uniref:Uncharacterized protein n=1 Tax=Dipteronia dyeriana TaxID=168575 RepID=A0AAD9TI56_9ROSI|nr:hypothetical protein Ddye_031029 [Dipteronia dyeriana]
MVSNEEEDLDQYLVYSKNTWSFNITINTHHKHKFIRQIESVLDNCGELDEFRSRCFGHYLDLSAGGYFQAQYMHNLILRQITHPGVNMNEMWFVLGMTKFWTMEVISVMCHKLGHYIGSGYPCFKKIDFIIKASKIRETWLEMELEGKLTGQQELTPTKRESKQDYWVDVDVDVDMSIGPRFEPSILIGANEGEA